MRHEIQAQREFLLEAMEILGLDEAAFAKRLNASDFTLRKWLADPDDPPNYQELRPIVWSHVREILAHEALRKRLEHVSLPSEVVT
ncbi:transcriptional regulator [Duganella vulcania]|uniref:Transcriptional regulator n=1 Tax=Duganella vulcania TaxID=2692166 RepID=A0A845GEV2_9BURK|nr:transcriptional regulator [Duganella vulcania]MYM92441.1 transcriptional regulator [Duganella vulcania]